MNALDSRERIHLEWMFENQPDLVRQLHQSNQLRPHLDGKMQEALRVVDRLKASPQRLSEDDAFEVAQAEVLAPNDGPALSDNPPPPLPLREQEEIYRKLET